MPRRAKRALDPAPPNVPAYIVTFSDMVTLLLTFFVLLISMAQTQDGALYGAARGGFIKHMQSYGLGMLFGNENLPDFGNIKARYPSSQADSRTPTRTIDAQKEILNHLFEKAAESVQMMPTVVGVSLSDYLPTNILFARGQPDLDSAGQKYLSQFSSELKSSAGTAKTELYILCLANEESTEKQNWMLSSVRAQKVADYLAQAGLKMPIYAWGAGPGGWWVEEDSPISNRSQVFIAIVRFNN